MSTLNHQFRLASRPVGAIKRSDFEFAGEDLREPSDGEVQAKVLYLSLDPAMRGWMNASKESYIPPVGIGEVMRALGLGRVTASHDPNFKLGDHVTGVMGIQEYATVKGQTLTKVDPKLAPLPLYLGTLGMPGLTAYFGVIDEGQVKEGDTVVVSGAAGAVGAVVGQLAKIKGARVIGIAGGAEKCRYLVDDLGFDAAIDYKNDDLHATLKEHAPKGVDLYFDNVGGEILDTVLMHLALHARIVICGAISQYNNDGAFKGPSNYMALLVKRATMKGFLVADYYPRAKEAVTAMTGFIKAGRLKTREEVVQGLETFPETFNRLFSGEKLGKLVLQVAAE